MRESRPEAMAATKGMGPFAQPGVQPPLNQIYSQLRDIWKSQEKGRTYVKLAELLGETKQNITQWATGSDNRVPPWFVILYLCESTGYEVRCDSRKWRLVSKNKGRKAAS